MRLHHRGPQPAPALPPGGFVPSYASRDGARAADYCRRHGGVRSYSDYASAIADPRVDAVVVAVPPKFHLDLTLQALAAGKHVLVEKPAFLSMADYDRVREARDRAGRIVLVGENDHYKPLAVCLRQLLARRAIGEMVFAHFTTIARRLKTAGRLAQRRNDGRRGRVLRGGHPLAAPRGQPRASDHDDPRATARRRARQGPDRRAKSMMVAFRYDNGAVGSLYYSREIPSLLKGLRLSKLFGRDGIITFESNGAVRAGARSAACRGSSSRASATSAATRRCTATSTTPFATAARPR